MSVTFDVADVTANDSPFEILDMKDAKKFFFKKEIIEASYISKSKLIDYKSAGLGVPTNLHGLLAAVHIAYDNHLPLVLSPDHIWLCIAQGLGIHINLNAEELRHHFVSHSGKLEIKIRDDTLVKGASTNNWESILDRFSDVLKSHIRKKRDLIINNFSTTATVERVASEIVLMEAMSPYFDYTVITRCGIPRITLLGTLADWQSIRQKAQVLSEFGLEWWTKDLIPVLDQFVAAHSGKIDKEFWDLMYKDSDGSGGPYITGWINVLFPYIYRWQDGAEVLNGKNGTMGNWKASMGRHFGGGPTLGAFSSGMSRAPFKWEYYSEIFNMEFVSGFGVATQQSDGSVAPEIGWFILDKTP